MAFGNIANRTLEGRREVWRIENTEGEMVACGRTVSQLIAMGFAWGHFPTRRGSAGITDAGRIEARRLGYEVKL